MVKEEPHKNDASDFLPGNDLLITHDKRTPDASGMKGTGNKFFDKRYIDRI